MEKLLYKFNTLPKTGDKHLNIMSKQAIASARRFHESFPQYAKTPLARLGALSAELGLADIRVKDESWRFGLNAFKVLGGSFAIAHYIADQLERDVCEMNYDYLTSEKLKSEFGQATFFTATDGNHGRGVAWAANKLGQNAVVFMPKGTQKIRLENILKENARASIQECNYDECVRMAAAEAAKVKNGVVVQDTAWEGYELIPSYIMQGYGTMASEAAEQCEKKPTHVFVQAGVGSLAGAVVGYFSNLYPDAPPKFIVVEANAANCLYRSAVRGDGETEVVDGDMQTIMAGLACGEANTISWDILRNHADCFVSIPDSSAANGMRLLGAPLRGDDRVISGESGAAPAGALFDIMTAPELSELREGLKIGADSSVLLFSTEGDTDPENYKNVVWRGKYAR